MIDGVQTAGTLWCPRCFARTEFFVVPGQESVEVPDIECCVCEYVFAKVVREGSDGKVEVVDPLGAKTRAEARTRQVEDFKRNVLANGYRVENFTLRRPNDARRTS